jgi:hypothetical protein
MYSRDHPVDEFNELDIIEMGSAPTSLDGEKT